MSPKVVSISGAPVATEGAPDPALVEILEQALVEAKAGKLTDLALISIDGKGFWKSGWVAEFHGMQMVGCLHFLSNLISDSYRTPCECCDD